MNTLRLSLAILLSSLFIPFAYADETVSIKVGYASITPSGNFSATGAGVPGTNFTDQSLGLGKSNNVTAEVAFQLGDGRLSASYLPLKFNGTSNVTGNFNGQPFNGTVATELKLDVFDIAYTYYLVNMDDMPSRFQFGIEAALKSFKVDGRMSGGGATSTASATVPLPTIGIRARVALADFIGLSGRYGYIGYNGNNLSDFDAQIEFSPIPTLGIYGGYRAIDINIDSSGVIVNSTFSGPFAGAFFRF